MMVEFPGVGQKMMVEFPGVGQNNGRIPGGGAKFSKLEETAP